MGEFDFEPEDSWDATDPPRVKLANLLRRLQRLDADLRFFGVRDRELLRLAQIMSDVADLKERLP